MCCVEGAGEGDLIRLTFGETFERFVGDALLEADGEEACRFDMMLSARVCGNVVVDRVGGSERRGRQSVRGSIPRRW